MILFKPLIYLISYAIRLGENMYYELKDDFVPLTSDRQSFITKIKQEENR